VALGVASTRCHSERLDTPNDADSAVKRISGQAHEKPLRTFSNNLRKRINDQGAFQLRARQNALKDAFFIGVDA
jgi:hypothetical protein